MFRILIQNGTLARQVAKKLLDEKINFMPGKACKGYAVALWANQCGYQHDFKQTVCAMLRGHGFNVIKSTSLLIKEADNVDTEDTVLPVDGQLG